VTRAAHETAWYSNIDGIEEAELQATQLVYVRNIKTRIDAGLSKWETGW
jgi:hypothetical protein